MSAPAWASSGTYTTISFQNALRLPVPSSVAANDVIVVSILCTDTISSDDPAFVNAYSSPIANGPGARSIYIFWKRATGADTGTYNFTGSNINGIYAGMAHRFTGAFTSGTLFDYASTGDVITGSFSSSGTVTPTVSLTTRGSDRLLLFAGGGNTTSHSWTPPTAGGTWTELFVGSSSEMTFDWHVQSTAGSTGNVSANNSSNDYKMAWIGALKPIPTPSPPATTSWFRA